MTSFGHSRRLPNWLQSEFGYAPVSPRPGARSKKTCLAREAGRTVFPRDKRQALAPRSCSNKKVTIGAGFNGSEPGAGRSALHHRDRHAPDLALGADLHGLLVAVGPQRQIGGKSGCLDKHVDLATARRALEIAENIPARLAPAAGNPVAIARDIAAQVELVAVAGAMQALLQTESGAVDLVVGLAANALGRSVGKSDGAVSGPCAAEAGKWTRLGMAR
jgi:hypothetical protein